MDQHQTEDFKDEFFDMEVSIQALSGQLAIGITFIIFYKDLLSIA